MRLTPRRTSFDLHLSGLANLRACGLAGLGFFFERHMCLVLRSSQKKRPNEKAENSISVIIRVWDSRVVDVAKAAGGVAII